jgi:hypothetical protein
MRKLPVNERTVTRGEYRAAAPGGTEEPDVTRIFAVQFAIDEHAYGLCRCQFFKNFF